MTRLALYTAMYVVLFALATVQALVEFAGLLETAYWTAFGLIILLSFLKAVAVAGYYQHLRWEPRPLTVLLLLALLAALGLTTAASYSIT